MIKALGILNEEHAPGSFAHGIPHPMVFVIDAKGVLRARFSEAKYSDRPDSPKISFWSCTKEHDCWHGLSRLRGIDASLGVVGVSFEVQQIALHFKTAAESHQGPVRAQ